MAVRSGMADLIEQLRGFCDAGTADYTIGTAAFWSDQQLQDALDDHSAIVDFASLAPISQRVGAAYQYKIYTTPYQNWESAPVITDGLGTAIAGTLYTWDGRRGRATFTADQAGSARTISGTIYDLYAAAADVWKAKLDHYAAAYDVSTDNHSLHRSQLAAQAKERWQYYASRVRMASGGNAIDVERGDMNVACW